MTTEWFDRHWGEPSARPTKARFEMSMTRDTLQAGWQYRAKCQGPQAVLFFAPNGFERKEERRERESEARAICAVCAVVEECLEYALHTREEHGVWGGLNETQRRALAERAG